MARGNGLRPSWPSSSRTESDGDPESSEFERRHEAPPALADGERAGPREKPRQAVLWKRAAMRSAAPWASRLFFDGGRWTVAGRAVWTARASCWAQVARACAPSTAASVTGATEQRRPRGLGPGDPGVAGGSQSRSRKRDRPRCWWRCATASKFPLAKVVSACHRAIAKQLRPRAACGRCSIQNPAPGRGVAGTAPCDSSRPLIHLAGPSEGGTARERRSGRHSREIRPSPRARLDRISRLHRGTAGGAPIRARCARFG
jgi:hypothetical protein